jgi:hypothetical protein
LKKAILKRTKKNSHEIKNNKKLRLNSFKNLMKKLFRFTQNKPFSSKVLPVSLNRRIKNLKILSNRKIDKFDLSMIKLLKKRMKLHNFKWISKVWRRKHIDSKIKAILLNRKNYPINRLTRSKSQLLSKEKILCRLTSIIINLN